MPTPSPRIFGSPGWSGSGGTKTAPSDATPALDPSSSAIATRGCTMRTTPRGHARTTADAWTQGSAAIPELMVPVSSFAICRPIGTSAAASTRLTRMPDTPETSTLRITRTDENQVIHMAADTRTTATRKEKRKILQRRLRTGLRTVLTGRSERRGGEFCAIRPVASAVTHLGEGAGGRGLRARSCRYRRRPAS